MDTLQEYVVGDVCGKDMVVHREKRDRQAVLQRVHVEMWKMAEISSRSMLMYQECKYGRV